MTAKPSYFDTRKEVTLPSQDVQEIVALINAQEERDKAIQKQKEFDELHPSTQELITMSETHNGSDVITWIRSIRDEMFNLFSEMKEEKMKELTSKDTHALSKMIENLNEQITKTLNSHLEILSQSADLISPMFRILRDMRTQVRYSF